MNVPITVYQIMSILDITDLDNYSLNDVIAFLQSHGIIADPIPDPILIVGRGHVHHKEDNTGNSKLATYPILMVLVQNEPHILLPFSLIVKYIWLGTQIRNSKFPKQNGDINKYCKANLNARSPKCIQTHRVQNVHSNYF